MAIFNKKNPKKKAAPQKRQKPKPQTKALAPVKPFPPFGSEPFAPYTPPPMLDFSMKKPPEGRESPIRMPEFDPEKEFLKTFKKLTYRHRAWDIWNDFIVMSACALSNPVDKTHYDEREARYLRIINKYRKEEQEHFLTLFAHMVMALELNPEQDFLGKLYTGLGLQDEGRKQFFTPYHVCELMADITMDDVVQQVRENGYVSLNDPCCGAGATLIAGINSAKKNLQKADLNFQNHILVTAQDIDETVALMCYIQLSLLGMAAYVKVGNSLTEPMTSADTLENYWFTPMYFSDVWAMRRLFHKLDGILRETSDVKKQPFRLLVKLEKNDCHCNLTKFYIRVTEKAGFALKPGEMLDCSKIRTTKAVQDAIYAFYRDRGGSDLDIAMLWANQGPKADLDGDGYAVEIEDGFVAAGDP